MILWFRESSWNPGYAMEMAQNLAELILNSINEEWTDFCMPVGTKFKLCDTNNRSNHVFLKRLEFLNIFQMWVCSNVWVFELPWPTSLCTREHHRSLFYSSVHHGIRYILHALLHMHFLFLLSPCMTLRAFDLARLLCCWTRQFRFCNGLSLDRKGLWNSVLQLLHLCPHTAKIMRESKVCKKYSVQLRTKTQCYIAFLTGSMYRNSLVSATTLVTFPAGNCSTY